MGLFALGMMAACALYASGRGAEADSRLISYINSGFTKKLAALCVLPAFSWGTGGICSLSLVGGAGLCALAVGNGLFCGIFSSAALTLLERGELSGVIFVAIATEALYSFALLLLFCRFLEQNRAIKECFFEQKLANSLLENALFFIAAGVRAVVTAALF